MTSCSSSSVISVSNGAEARLNEFHLVIRMFGRGSDAFFDRDDEGIVNWLSLPQR